MQDHEDQKDHAICRVKDNSPLDGKYLHGCIVYQANLIINNNVTNTLEKLKRSLNCATIIATCHLNTRNV